MFEERMAAGNGRAALAVSSGLAAQMTALLTLLSSGDMAPHFMVQLFTV